MALPAIIAKLMGGALLASAYKKYGKKMGKEFDKVKKEKSDKEFKKMLEERQREREKKDK
jgi:hypothetical protein